MPIGFSYSPGSDIPMNGERGSASQRHLSPQQAVKILSLRVPEHVPGNAPISGALMNAPGSLGALGSMIAQLASSRVQVPGLESPAIDTGQVGGPRPPVPFAGPVGPALPSTPPPIPRVRPGGDDAPKVPNTAQPALPMAPQAPEEDPLLSYFKQNPQHMAGLQAYNLL